MSHHAKKRIGQISTGILVSGSFAVIGWLLVQIYTGFDVRVTSIENKVGVVNPEIDRLTALTVVIAHRVGVPSSEVEQLLKSSIVPQ